MNDFNLFQWLVKYHAEVNLPHCLQYINPEGTIAPPANRNKPVLEGRENKEYGGILILRNGSTLIRRLVSEKRIDRRDIDEPIEIGGLERLFDFLGTREDEDGAYVYETAEQQMRRVGKIKYPDREIEGRIPINFVYEKPYETAKSEEEAWLELRRMLGTKTRLAIEMGETYTDIDFCQIKRSGYTKLGMGKITRFDKDGLKEEFFFKADPTHQGQFINEQHHVIGVYRRYEKQEGKGVVQVEERYIGPDLNLGQIE